MSDDWFYLENNELRQKEQIFELDKRLTQFERIIESLLEESRQHKEQINELDKKLSKISQKMNRKTTL